MKEDPQFRVKIQKPKVVKPPKHKQTIAKLTEFNEDD
jgi:hypothetical protein